MHVYIYIRHIYTYTHMPIYVCITYICDMCVFTCALCSICVYVLICTICVYVCAYIYTYIIINYLFVFN